MIEDGAADANRTIRIRGVRQNNLKGIDLDLPLGQFIVVTGPSGGGKSSLAFDTIYAEGQRRYVETFSPYTRQFLDRMDKPQADSIEGIPPAIAIEQSNHVKSTRSTVGTITEVNDYLKLLMPRTARAFCPTCDREVRPETPQGIVESALRNFTGKSLLIIFSVEAGEQAAKAPADFFQFLQTQGYLRVWLYGKLLRTDEPAKLKSLPGRVDVVQDRIEVTPANRARLLEAVEIALRFGKGHVALIEPETNARHPHSTGWHCAHCDLEIRPPTPGLFTFNNPLGACPECRGFGRVIGIDYDRALPDRSLSIADGVVKPFQGGFSRECQDDLVKHCRERDIDIAIPFEDLPKRDQKFVIEGEGKADTTSEEIWADGKWYGVKGYFDWMESKAYKMHVRVLLSRYRSYRLCPVCNGGRFQPQTLVYQLVGADGSRKTLPDIAVMPIRDLEPFFDTLPLDKNDPSAELLRHQVGSRIHYLNEVGLGYLSLDRPTRTLSGGEIERVNLTSCLGASLVNTLFVMDEPSVGLHPRDTRKLVEIMHRLRNKGNTLLVVEHEEAVIRSADYLVDIGPGRGAQGGEIVFAGPAAEITRQTNSLTTQYLTGVKGIPIPEYRREPLLWVEFNGIEHHNLHKLDVKIPLGVFCCITGVSGSGKSSLVRDVIYRNLDFNPAAEGEAPGHVREMDGGELVDETLLVDQSPLARSPRSTPALYLGVFDKVRELFGLSKEAIAAGLTPSSFSFNSGNGRCERCGGLGFEKIEMQFLSDLFLRCPECDGRRYRAHVLEIKIDGKSIHDVLEMTVRESIEFFAKKESRGEITGPLKLMSEVGLDYLRIGQPVNVLSGGESQRLKLVHRLVTQKQAEGSMLIFDEPTTGLHFDDIALLLKVFQRLVNEGHSLLVIEHNLEVIKSADWVIDLGPEAGDRGGQLVAEGTPEQVALVEASHTGRFLKEILAGTAKDALHSAVENPQSDAPNVIAVRGAREHNLKNISVDIPRDEMVVVTGLSGSGKSTLAFDILFAEGQRRFLDSMSPYARQFVEQLEKPEVDHVDGLPPSVAIEQRVTRGGGKSTVATVTEIYHFLRLLFAKLGTQHCPDCHVAVESNSLSSVLDVVRKLATKGKLQIYAPLVRGRKGFHTEVARWADRQGFEYLMVDGKLTRVDGFQKLERFKEHTIDVLVGEITDGKQKDAEGLLKRALEIGKGTAKALDAKHKFHILSTEMNCPSCGRAFEELDPRLFSFNSPHGWCTHCRGFGEVWSSATDKSDQFETQLEADLDEESRYEKLEEGEASTCPICRGDRLNEVARSVFLQGKTISHLTGSQASQTHGIIKNFKFKGTQQEIARDVVEEIMQRLTFLNEVGLNYLSLNRSTKTLSGGESQRIRLAAQLGSNLRGVLYVLDEPTIGLHPRDNDRLLNSLQQLTKKGNSLLIVEHDEDTMRRADRLIDLGPQAGRNGGEIIVNGTIEEVLKSERSLTGKALREPMSHPLRGERRSLKDVEWLELEGARKHNLNDVDVKIPLQRLTAISGVSGSGKSTLIRGVLVPALQSKLQPRTKHHGHEGREWKNLLGAEKIGGVLEVDQSPIGKTSRSTPATYVKLFDEIRKVYAQLPEARIRGYTASRFSFNNEGGRCETCQGQGIIKLEMSFLPTSYMPCEDCGGKRFNPATLEVLYNGKSIGDVLGMTIEQAADFFTSHPKLKRPLDLLNETGLGYLQLGQPSPTLSGGEAQRIKLVAELASRASAHEQRVRTGRMGKSTFYVLEEPTIGLHAADVAKLIDVLHRLVDDGGTVIVIEHHLDVIAEADHLIDVGPEAGEDGGKIIAIGTPEQVARVKGSHTAKFLKPLLVKN